MIYKKIIISILLLVLSVTAVSATDFENNSVIESSDVDDSSICVSFVESSQLQDSKELNASTGTFNQLQSLIDNASEKSVLDLTMDYKGSKNSKIKLDKDLTINGNGHTIDCLDKEGCIAFYSSSGTITLKNLKIINGQHDFKENRVITYGGAIYITGTAKYIIENCTFENNLNWVECSGGAIYNGASNTLTIKDCTFKSNDVKRVKSNTGSDANGGAIFSEGPLNIENSKFMSNLAFDYGGAVYACDTLNIFNCIFESNEASVDYGGAVHSKGNVKIVNSTFKNNFAKARGGALYAEKDAIINTCVFESNKVDGMILGEDSFGGAIVCTGTLYINNSTFKNNYADDYGGAIVGKDIYINFDQNPDQSFSSFFINNEVDDDIAGAIRAKGILYIKNTVFSGNKAYVDGGAIYANDDVNVNHCLFESNEASGALSQCYGGAIRSKGDVYVESSTFKDNYAEDYGGAIYANNVYINLKQANPQTFSSFFTNNKASDNQGGAIYAKGYVKAFNAVFSGNKADIDGGAIYSEDDVTVKYCLFESNRASGEDLYECYGGAIRADDVYVENSTFKDNYAEDYGGAIYADSVSINVNQNCNQAFNSFFINNKAGDNKGGAIYGDDGNIKAVNTVFSGNIALVDGGAIYGDDNVYVTHCLFENNKADGAKIMSCYGGAFRAQDNAVVDNCTFRNNYAENEGGAIYADTLILRNTSVFEGNTARDYGGAIWVNTFKEDVKYNIFIGNKAKKEDGGAIYIDNKNSVVFSSNVFINNTCGDEGGAIYGDDNDFKISLKYNIFIGNDAGDTGDSVYICGQYKEIINNYWGGKNPTKKNGQLIEWMPLFIPNDHHVDSDPLTMVLVTDGSAIIGQTVTVTLMFYKSDGTPCTGPILNDAVVFNVSNAKIINKMSNEFSVSIDLIPEDVGSFEVSANLYGISVSETFRVYDGKITDSDINRLLQRISDLKNSS
ncbi:right-handed parallel beta-helix repeat-containing protein [Methanobrevibacter sp.]|uniref:right-handed parallel beta-helix repeat-containing protein n=1 Tax=Methanobrevibacter sp. TaxID=66852 RepID=UPI00388F28D4